MADQSHVRQSSLLAVIHKVANRPDRTAARTYIQDGRACLVLFATAAVAINAWALFPSTTESEKRAPLPDTSTTSAADFKSARAGVVGNPVNASRLISAELVPSKPTMYGSLTVQDLRPAVAVSPMQLRLKLQALLMLLNSQSGDVELAALEEKLQALLKLPDSVLAQLLEHPDLADLNKVLDAVLLGTSDLSALMTELDKIDVASVSGPTERIYVIEVNGKPAYVLRGPARQKGADNAAGSPASAPPPSESLTVTTPSQIDAPAGLTASAFALAPSSEPLTTPPAPADQSASTFMVAPSGEPLSSTPSASPTPSASVEPTATSQTSDDIMTSGNKFEPGEAATQPSDGSSSATQTATPSTSPTGQEIPAGAGGVTSGEGTTSPSNNEGGGTSSSSGGEASP